MDNLPIRPRNHILETISENYLRTQIPPEWILSKSEIDYGTDFNCEVSIENQVIGTNFSIQLKAKEKDENETFVLVKKLKKGTINRWLKRLEPTAIVVYVEELKEAFWTWIEKDTFDLTKKNKTYQIKIPKTNILSLTDWKKLHADVEIIFSKRYRLYELPKNITKIEEQETWNLYINHNYPLALLGFNKLIKIDSENPLFWNSIAICEYQLYNYKKALIAINKALELKDDNSIRLNKASILTEYGTELQDDHLLELAIKEYNQLLPDNFDNNVLYNYANCQKALKQFVVAKDSYEKSLQINPNNAKAWKNLGSVYFELQNHNLEIVCYDNALEIEPNLSEAIFSKGVTTFKIFGKTEQGLELMIKAEKLDANKNYELSFPYVYFWIAEAYLDLKNIEKASKWNKKGLTINPIDNYFIQQSDRIKMA